MKTLFFTTFLLATTLLLASSVVLASETVKIPSKELALPAGSAGTSGPIIAPIKFIPNIKPGK